jgi:hypothetical protein
MIIYIYNNTRSHYEVIISIIEKYDKVLSINKNNDNIIYLSYKENDSFTKYIKDRYPNILLTKPKKYDYFINCSMYEKYISQIINDNKHFYIVHEITENLLKKNNVYYLTPLCNNNKYIYCDILPYQNDKTQLYKCMQTNCNYQRHTNLGNNGGLYCCRACRDSNLHGPACEKKSLIPIYVIQGNIQSTRRNYDLLIRILDYTYKYKFKIKIVGRGKLPEIFDKYSDVIDCKYNYDFIDYHKEFLNCYCIIPLITKESHPQYYTNKLTSTINYGKAYNLKFLIDQDLQDI